MKLRAFFLCLALVVPGCGDSGDLDLGRERDTITPPVTGHPICDAPDGQIARARSVERVQEFLVGRWVECSPNGRLSGLDFMPDGVVYDVFGEDVDHLRRRQWSFRETYHVKRLEDGRYELSRPQSSRVTAVLEFRVRPDAMWWKEMDAGMHVRRFVRVAEP